MPLDGTTYKDVLTLISEPPWWGMARFSAPRAHGIDPMNEVTDRSDQSDPTRQKAANLIKAMFERLRDSSRWLQGDFQTGNQMCMVNALFYADHDTGYHASRQPLSPPALLAQKTIADIGRAMGFIVAPPGFPDSLTDQATVCMVNNKSTHSEMLGVLCKAYETLTA